MARQRVQISAMATSSGHGEDSPYFDGWKEYERNPFHHETNPHGVIQLGLAENQLSYDMIEEWQNAHPDALNCRVGGLPMFRQIANYQDYHGLPEFRIAMASFMEEVRGNRVTFDEKRIVLAAGATAASEVLTFCVANPGEAFLVPTPFYPGFIRDLKWRTQVEIVPVQCHSSNNFQITKAALEEAYMNAKANNIKIKGLVLTNPSNPLGTTMDAETLRMALDFAEESNIHLICDEIYAGSVFSEPAFVSIAEVLANHEDADRVKSRVHILYSLSKDMGFPGFRVGVLYSYNDEVVTAARRMSSFGLISTQTQHLVATMLSDKSFVKHYLMENRKRLNARRTEFEKGLRDAGIDCLEGNGGLFCWVDLRQFLKTPDVEGEMWLWKKIIYEVGLNVSPGSSCMCTEPGWFRFVFANMSEIELHESLARIKRFTNAWWRSKRFERSISSPWEREKGKAGVVRVFERSLSFSLSVRSN